MASTSGAAKLTSDMNPTAKTTKQGKFHVVLALDGSHHSEEAFKWLIHSFLKPRADLSNVVVYLLSVIKLNPQAAMVYSAGVGRKQTLPSSPVFICI